MSCKHISKEMKNDPLINKIESGLTDFYNRKDMIPVDAGCSETIGLSQAIQCDELGQFSQTFPDDVQFYYRRGTSFFFRDRGDRKLIYRVPQSKGKHAMELIKMLRRGVWYKLNVITK